MHMEVGAIFGRFVWRGVNIDDVTIHPSRGSRINPTLKVCKHNWVTHASSPLVYFRILNIQPQVLYSQPLLKKTV